MSKVSKRALLGASKGMSWACLALLALLTAAGCNEVRKCKVGELGCIDEAPDEGRCAAGLVLKGGKCVEPEGGGGSCNCAIDELCAPDGKTCIAYCEPVSDLPAANPTPPSCTPIRTAGDPNPAPFDFQKLCFNTCMQNCLRAETFCPGFKCDPTRCMTADTRLVCNTECPGMDVDCMETSCIEQSKIACGDFLCPLTATRNCQDITCRDSCTGNTDDGFCDDGDPYSATYSFCAYGTDCTDCGPRRGPRPEGIPLGEPCPEGQDVACKGYNDNFLRTEAWCLRFIADSSAPYRCVPDCTEADGGGRCDDGYECQAVLTSDGEPYRDATNNQTAGYACVPQICE